MEEERPTEIKDLNKTQLILLAILLSFVTSIVTGITTVTLMQQASVGVTQTINRVVERTIQTVVPEYNSSTTQTVIVKEDDLVVDAVAKARSNSASVFVTKDATEPTGQAYSVGNGLFIASISSSVEAPVILFRDMKYDAKVLGTSPLGFSLLSAVADNTKVFPKASFAKDTDSKAGQTAVLVSDKTISKGIIQSVILKEEKDAEGKITALWHIIVLDSAPSVGMIGSLSVNLDGNVTGMVLPKTEGGAQIIGVDAITKFIAVGGKTAS